MVVPSRWLTIALVAALAGPAARQAGAQVGAQAGAAGGQPAPAAGGLLPPLPAVAPGSPRDSLLFADRAEVTPTAADYPPDYEPLAVGPELIDTWIPAALTGTTFPELVQYQLPTSYDPGGAPIPLLVAWHGFGASAASVSNQTTLDEWCESSGWAYLSVTGIDDALFGSPPSQQNAEAAIQWMLDNFTIDPDRIHMVGFSMGAGIVSNFAARHRDPDGIMIAGLGLVSGSFDWVAVWYNDPSIRVWLQNAYNFGSTPAANSFAYRRVGALAFNTALQPPNLAWHQPQWAMATNLHDIPTYLTWDTGESINYLAGQSTTFDSLLNDMGTPALVHSVSDTVDAGGAPATHSWAVLDEAEMFAFLAPQAVLRLPSFADCQLDQDGEVSWMSVSQAQTGAFTWAGLAADPSARQIELDGVMNAAEVALDLGTAGMTGNQPVRVIATSDDAVGFTLRLAGTATTPSYLADSLTGAPLPDVESDPFGDALLLDVPARGTRDVTVVQLGWGSRLWLLPDPAAPGSAVGFGVDAPTGSLVAWTLIGFQQALAPLAGGITLLVSPMPPALLLPVPLDSNGDAQIAATLPNNASLHGISLVLQAVIQGAGGPPSDATNVFRFDIE